MTESSEKNGTSRPRALVLLQGRAYMHPYFRRAFGADYETEISPEPLPGEDYDVRVCVLGPGDTMPAVAADIPVIEVPDIVATGMEGLPRRLAEDVASGRFFAIRDFHYPRVRVVHATDVAAAARLAAERGEPGRWTLDDGENPALDILADALAFRIKGKRLFALPRRWAMFLGIGRAWRRLAYIPAEGPRFDETFGFKPTPVCEYLRTHVYDENSL